MTTQMEADLWSESIYNNRIWTDGYDHPQLSVCVPSNSLMGKVLRLMWGKEVKGLFVGESEDQILATPKCSSFELCKSITHGIDAFNHVICVWLLVVPDEDLCRLWISLFALIISSERGMNTLYDLLMDSGNFPSLPTLQLPPCRCPFSSWADSSGTRQSGDLVGDNIGKTFPWGTQRWYDLFLYTPNKILPSSS